MVFSVAARVNKVGARLGLTLPKMYDSVSVGELPSGAYAYAGYVDGDYPTWDAVVGKFERSGAKLLSITVNGADWALAHAIDDEPGDENNAQAVQFSLDRLRLGQIPVIYTQASNIAALTRALSSAGITRAKYLLWSAHYTGSSHFCSTRTCGFGTTTAADATQYASSQYNPIGGNKDISVVSATFFGSLPKPSPRPPTPVKHFWKQVADGTKSLDEVSVARHMTATAIYEYSIGAGSPITAAERAALTKYARGGKDGGETTYNKMPRGLVYFTYNP